MDAKTRARACRLIEKLDRHPAFAERIVIIKPLSKNKNAGK